MRFAFATVALTSAADSERPVISLNLPANLQKEKWDGMTAPSGAAGGLYTNYRPADRRNSGHSMMTSSPRYSGAKNSFADECFVNTPAHNGQIGGVQRFAAQAAVDYECQEPRAAAYDHHDGDITDKLTTTYTLFVKSDVKTMPTRPGSLTAPTGPASCVSSSSCAVNFGQRGEVVINYDVTDNANDGAGNAAEQVEFALLLVDEEAPFFVNSPAYYVTQGTKDYTDQTKHCTNTATCSTTQSGNPESYRTYYNDQGEDNIILELCGDLSGTRMTMPGLALGDTLKNLYWHDPSYPLAAFDKYDGVLNEQNSAMSVEGSIWDRKLSESAQPAMAKFEDGYKIDVFEYNAIDDHFHTDSNVAHNGIGRNKFAHRDMTFPRFQSLESDNCLNEMKTGLNHHGNTMFSTGDFSASSWMDRDANGAATTLLASYDFATGCDLKQLMDDYQASSATPAVRDNKRNQCVRCLGAYREYVTDSATTSNVYIEGVAANTGLVAGQKVGTSSADQMSDCWSGMQSHQFENWYCGKPLLRWADYELVAEDFADIFGLSNQNNKVTESGKIFFQDSIIPTIHLPTSISGTGGENKILEYECGYKINAKEGAELCTFADSLSPSACASNNDCGSSDRVCEFNVCKTVGVMKNSVCTASDGSTKTNYWTKWLAELPSGEYVTSYRPNIKYEDCYDTHAKQERWVHVTDDLNPKLDFDITSSNFAGVEGECKQTHHIADLDITVPVYPRFEVNPTPATLYQSLYRTIDSGDGNGSLYTKCVAKCNADIARASGYASGTISHTGGCTTYCDTVAEYDGFQCHSKARAVPLSYNVQDNFGNWAKTDKSFISIVDTIPPTLYITTHKYRAAVDELNSEKCDDERAARLVDSTGAEQTVCPAGAPTGVTADPACYVEGHHRVMEHCDNTRFCQVNGVIHTGTACDNKVMHGMYELEEHNRTYQSGAATLDSRTNQLLDQEIIQHSAGYAGDYRWVEQLLMEGTGYECHDICSTTTTKVEWHTSCTSNTGTGVHFDILNPGTYYLKYTCNDEAGLKWAADGQSTVARPSMVTTACRTFINVDKTKPVITVFDYANNVDSFYHVEATRDNNYVDAGAACSDMVDGNLNPDVQVSGDVVNMAAVGTYVIDYDCEDSAGHAALQAHRTVIVEDTTAPCCSIPDDEPTITVEASFPYNEVGSVCTDSIDGYIGAAHISGTVDIEMTGEYVLTYTATDMNNNGNIYDNGGCHTTKTVIVEDTMVPIISLKYRSHQLLGHSLMAEAAASNAWVIGAVASAISGVALLGYAATRKASASTTVPV